MKEKETSSGKMRTIKFRGMNVNGKFIYGYPCIRTNKNNVEFCDIEGVDEDGWFLQAFIKETLGQFTGLLDKNGKEIYEGDIISYIGYSAYGRDNHTSTLIIEWSEIGGGFELGWLFRKDDGDIGLSNIDIEVIGNIYEHKHLLGDN